MLQHELLKTYTNILIKSKDINSLVIRGSQGLGKTHSIISTLKEMDIQEEVGYIYISGKMTPLQLFNTLCRSSTLEHPKLFVMDDLDAILNDRTSVSILKSALWPARGRRIVSYLTSSTKVEEGGTHEFEGKILMIINNNREEGIIGRPLLDRGIY